MSSNTFIVTSSWTKIFDIKLNGYFGLYIQENNNTGSILFLEEGKSSITETGISDTRGINVIPYYNSILPYSFSLVDEPTRVYEIRKNLDYLEIHITSGTDVSVTFTLFSNFPDKSVTYTPKTNNTKFSSYQRLGTYNLENIKSGSAKCVSWMDDSATSYDVQIFDKTNKQILLTANLTNTSEGVQDLGSLTNLPSTPTQIEISVRKNGGNSGSKVYIESLTINYN